MKISHVFFLSFVAVVISVFSTTSAKETYISPDPLLEILLDAGLELPEDVQLEETSHFSPEGFTAIEVSPVLKRAAKDQKEADTCTIPAKIPAEIQESFSKAIENIPCIALQSLQRIEIFQDPEGQYPRAMANGRMLKIREDAIYKPEFIHVLQHELGHVVDLGYLRSQEYTTPSGYKDGPITIYADDISVEFYKLSWAKDGTRLPSTTDLDFVGGYSSGDMFEDFAESFLMYIKHGKEFRGLATENKVLAQKYQFFKTYIFDGKEFETGYDYYQSEYRPWDVTKH